MSFLERQYLSKSSLACESHVEQNDGLWKRGGKEKCVVGCEASFSYLFMEIINPSFVLLSHPLHLIVCHSCLNISSLMSL